MHEDMADIKADNESLVFALRTLGFYMERDRLVLEAMSLKDQNVRLKKAFDRAVENVCIMSLLYDVKESRAGKLKLSNRRKWSRWQENRNALFIQTISVIHIIDRPCSMSCFLQRQTGHIGKGGLGGRHLWPGGRRQQRHLRCHGEHHQDVDER